MSARWYPRGIQKIVSTYELVGGGVLGSPGQISIFGGGRVVRGSQNSKCQVMAKFQFGGRGRLTNYVIN